MWVVLRHMKKDFEAMEKKKEDLLYCLHMLSGHLVQSKLARETRQTIQEDEEDMVTEAGDEAEVVDVAKEMVTSAIQIKMTIILLERIKVKSNVLLVNNLVIMLQSVQTRIKVRRRTSLKPTKKSLFL